MRGRSGKENFYLKGVSRGGGTRKKEKGKTRSISEVLG